MLQNIAWTWAVIGLAAALVLSGCDNGKNGTPDGDDADDAPFTELIGGASVEIEPSGGFGDDYKLVYHDADDPMNTGLEATDPDSGVFIAVNVPPRSFDDPYTITVSHESLDFEQVDFAVQADVLTYLILSP